MLLEQETGLNVDSIGLLSIARAISSCMKNSNINDIHDFTVKINTDKSILLALIEEIKVPETWFFRDVECFNFIKNHLKDNAFKYNSSNKLRILSAPCSTGEEPYSAAMLALESGLNSDSLYITACDISNESVEYAKSGKYRNTSFRNDYHGFKEKFFIEESGIYNINNNIRNIPSFVVENITKSTFLRNESKYDFIFCKNLLIYLSDDARTRVLNNIKYLLKDDGVLLVGLSEINYFTRNGFDQIKHNMAFACKLSGERHSYFTEIKSVKTKKLLPTFKQEKRKVESPRDSGFMVTVPVQSSEHIENVKAMADKGDFASAEKLCSSIIYNESLNSEALYYMGLIQNALKNSHKAAEYFKKVLYLQPDHYESLIHISLYYESLGESDRALLYRERAERAYLRNNAAREGLND